MPQATLARLFAIFLSIHCALNVSFDLRAADEAPKVIAPPESFFDMVRQRDRDAARLFYKKYIDVQGMPVVSSGEVADLALQRTHDIVSHLLAGRPDVLQSMVANQMYLIIIGKEQVYTDMPENRNERNPTFMNERVRGTGGKPTSFGEENLLSLPLDRYDDESIGVHEFCHTIDSTLRSVDPAWTKHRDEAFRNAMNKGLWKNTYAASNPEEYWAEICQSFFDCNRVNNWNHGPVGTREQLKIYDPEGYELVRTEFRLPPNQDWRYSFLQKLPNITAPPAKLNIDPYYTKFTWAREFPICGREASDEALLKANDTIRKVFAYRHDILKALIAAGVKLVVLGPHERVIDLPECAKVAGAASFDRLARIQYYSPDSKLLVVAQENVVGNPDNPRIGDNQVIRVLADAAYQVTALRPVDPNWDKRGSEVQQYELRVKRLDITFDERLKKTFDEAMAAGRWTGTTARHNRVSYWVMGVLAYFNATGQQAAPHGAIQPITTRELLKDYDPSLYSLVHGTMAYEGHVDWRYTP